MDVYQELANAIIIRATKDYRVAMKKLSKTPDHRDALGAKRSLERFFRSDWFGVLTNADGKMILRELEKEVAE